MKTYLLHSLNMDQAQQKQFRSVICRYFGADLVTMGDLGLVQGLNQLQITQCVQCVKAKNIWDRP
ncbi:hypothetical protein BB987_19715 [Photorhabdus temperata]|uniref:Uncharacterized protein n=1 Tax=Photorhabdus khanii TaxID=1004150 RepID=A0A7C9KCC9_9GAMM|nr:hypothetical protein [Photorhabdus khanii]MQL47542.1 hypothetical protein [Photorhabdus khanii]OHV49413.1 hypothetical protein BB987_19715 [Photorhabdus temperata]